MSSIVINFPDCSGVDSTDQGSTVTVNATHCGPPGPPPLIPWWAFLLTALLVVALIVSVAIVRYRAHERKESENSERLQAEVEMAKVRTKCEYCGGVFEPKVAK